MDGRAVLKEIVGDAALAHLPIIVLTTSEDEDDVLRSYWLGMVVLPEAKT